MDAEILRNVGWYQTPFAASKIIAIKEMYVHTQISTVEISRVDSISDAIETRIEWECRMIVVHLII